MAHDVWRQIAPLLAEGGIREGDTVPIRDLQHALDQAAERSSGHWTGEQAATDLLALAGKARAHASLRMVVARQGGLHVLYGSVLARAATIGAWADLTGTAAADVTRTALR